MAIDPNVRPETGGGGSPIENEIPEYRAINGWAVASLLLGLVSLISFASLYFLVAAVGAVLCGGLAIRQIRRLPDLQTGAGLANAGIGLGLVCGLAATTTSMVQKAMIGSEATRFAEMYAEALGEGDFAEAFYWQAPPEQRRDRKPAEVLTMMQEQMAEEFDSDPRTFVVREILAAVKEPGHDIHVHGIEDKGFDGRTPYVLVLLGIEGPEDEEFALAELRAKPQGGAERWWINSLNYPYEVGSASRQIQPAHTHGGGGADHSH